MDDFLAFKHSLMSRKWNICTVFRYFWILGIRKFIDVRKYLMSKIRNWRISFLAKPQRLSFVVVQLNRRNGFSFLHFWARWIASMTQKDVCTFRWIFYDISIIYFTILNSFDCRSFIIYYIIARTIENWNCKINTSIASSIKNPLGSPEFDC